MIRWSMVLLFTFMFLELEAQETLQTQFQCGLEEYTDRFGDKLPGSRSLESMGFPSSISKWVENLSEDPFQLEFARLHQQYVDQFVGRVDRIDRSEEQEGLGQESEEEANLGFQIKEEFRVHLVSYEGPEGKEKFRKVLTSICNGIAANLQMDNLAGRCVESTIKKRENLEQFLKKHLSASLEYASVEFDQADVWDNFHPDDENACPGGKGTVAPGDHRFSRDDVTNTNLCFGTLFFLRMKSAILSGELRDEKGQLRGRKLVMKAGGKEETYAAPFSLVSPNFVINPAFFTVLGGNAEEWNKRVVEEAIGPFRML